MFLNDLAEVEAVDREAYSQRERPGTFQQGGNKELPVVASPLLPDTQKPHCFDKRPDVIEP